MGNILSYLKWRGDISFAEREFCDADNLVLSALAYADLAGIVPETGSGKTITVKEAAREYLKNKKDIKNLYGELLTAMAESARFEQANLSCYKEKKDTEAQIQYASMKIALGDGTYFLAYRGTDDSIVGWREDFCISYKVTPAQQEAVRWMTDVMTEQDGDYRIGGHSKGGNLSVYAAVMCPDELKEKIIGIYNNDGPGISDELLDRKKYKMVRGKITRIIPGFCVIGMLFEPDITPLIIESSAGGILQHDILTWQIYGDRLCLREETEEDCSFFNQVFHTWIESADMDQREAFTKEFFDALEAGGASTITEVANGGIDGFGTILLSIADSESRTKIVIGKLLHSWFIHLKHMDFRNILKSQDGVRRIVSIIAGIICMLVPEFAVQSIGIVITLFIFLWSGKKVLEYGLQEGLEKKKRNTG